LAFGALSLADRGAQRTHAVAAQHTGEIATESCGGFRYARIPGSRDEEAGLHAAGRTDDGGKLRCVAVYRGVGPKTLDGREIVHDAPQLLRALGDETGAKVLPVILLQGIQDSLERRQIVRPQCQIGHKVIRAPEGVGIGNVDREKGNLAGAKFSREIDKRR
jgi:hypothetical protein